VVFAGFNAGYGEAFDVAFAVLTTSPCSKRKKRRTTDVERHRRLPIDRSSHKTKMQNLLKNMAANYRESNNVGTPQNDKTNEKKNYFRIIKTLELHQITFRSIYI
jgi:hypothetical protein